MSLYRSETRRRPAGASPLEPHPGVSLHRSATRRRAGGAEQKKGYEVVRQGLKQLYPEEGSNRTTDIE